MKLLQKIRSVDKDDPHAVSFADEIGAERVVQPSSESVLGTGPFQWISNIDLVVQEFGGECCFGWALWCIPGLVMAARHHAIWKTSTGKFYDVTFGGMETSFAIDNSIARDSFRPTGAAKFKRLRDTPELVELENALKYDFPRVGTSSVDVDFETHKRVNQIADAIEHAITQKPGIILP